MSDYKTLIGKSIKYLSSDPTDAGAEGQVWYNSTSGTFKTVLATGAWSSGSPLATAIFYNTGAGLQTAALSFGGSTSAPGTAATQTVEYNGSGWSIGGALPAGRVTSAGAGTQTAGLNAGGANAFPGTAQTTSEEYDGSTWTAGGSLSTGRRYTAGCGTQTAAIVNGGQNPGGTSIADTEEYDGSTWTSGGAWPKAIRQHVLLGTQTATLGSGGYSTTTEVEAYEYDGSTWTATGDMNQQRYVFQGFGTQTQGVVCGGEPTPSAGTLTEIYDGATFSTSPASLGNSTAQGGYGKSPGTAGLVFGNASGGFTGATEEYNFSATVITAGAWSSANSQSVPSYGRSGWGTANAGWLAGGNFPSAKTDTEEYDGTNWTSGGTLNTARGSASVGGPQTAAIFASGSRNSAVELYDGSTWTSTTAIPTVRSAAGGGGTQTSLVVFGGSVAGAPTFPISNAVEEWNGSAWTAGTSLPSVRGALNGSAFGTSSDDAFSAGGVTAPAPGAIPHSVTSETLSYNGTTWTEEADILTARASTYAFGTSGSAIIGGGDTNNSGAVSVLSEQWNGTSWSTNPSIATARYTGGRAGTSSSGWIGGGYPGGAPSSNATEEFTAEIPALDYKTLTSS